MSWPATLGTALAEFDRLAAIIKQRALQESTELEDPMTADRIVASVRELAGYRDRLAALRATPGMGAHALRVFGPGFDAAAESQAILDGIDSVEAWVNTNFPKSSGGYIEAQSFVGGTVDTAWRSFTAQQTAGLKAAYDALAATVD